MGADRTCWRPAALPRALEAVNNARSRITRKPPAEIAFGLEAGSDVTHASRQSDKGAWKMRDTDKENFLRVVLFERLCALFLAPAENAWMIIRTSNVAQP